MAYRFEKTEGGEYDIVIDGFEKGIAESPYKGIADMRNVDPTTIPGEASVAMAPEVINSQGPIAGVAFTVDDTTDVFTYNGVVPLVVGTAITVSNSGGALPTGMVANRAYYVKTTPSGTTFTLSATIGGTTLNVSDAGSGTNSFTTIDLGTPLHIRSASIIQNDLGSGFEIYILYFLLDSNGRCWVYDNLPYGNTLKWIYLNNLTSEASTKNGNGLAIWKNWLFVYEATSIRIMPLINDGFSTLIFLSTRTNWSTWQTIENLGQSDISHYTLIGQDDGQYFCNGYFVGSILEIEGETFAPNADRTGTDGQTTNNDPTFVAASGNFSILDIGSSITGDNIPDGTFIKSINSGTSVEMSNDATNTATGSDWAIPESYSYNDEALALPKTDQAVSLGELGVNLLVGGINNYIYPWDRISTSYNFPIFLSENYVARMVTVNTTTYIFCGRRGRIYKTNGSNANFYWKVPDYLGNTVNITFIWRDACFARNLVFFGFQAKQNDGTVINQYGGLWALTPEDGIAWLLNQSSYGTYAGYISALWQNIGNQKSTTANSGVFGNDNGYGLFTGWNSGSVGGSDKQGDTPYTGGQAYIDSDMMNIGTFLKKRTYQNIEFKLTTPLVSGESVALYYRTSITEAFTLVPLVAGGAVGDVSGYANVNFEKIQWLQVRAVLTSTNTTPSFVRLKELRVR